MEIIHKRFIVTKKQVTKFIENSKHMYKDIDEFKTDVQRAIDELSDPVGFNKAQIKYFTRVLEELNIKQDEIKF